VLLFRRLLLLFLSWLNQKKVDQYSFIDLFVHIYSLILSEEKEKERETEEAGREPLSRSRGRILVVDDEEDVTFFLKEALEELGGFEVVTFNDPLLALSSFNNDDKNNKPSAYDLILLDIKMPKMDGFELYQELQKRIGAADDNSSSISSGDQGKNGKRTKICFMTAFEVYFEALKELFPDSYPSMCFIKKPSSAQDLIKRISKEL
jgi:two-component system, OmpR family, response regulator ChvI